MGIKPEHVRDKNNNEKEVPENGHQAHGKKIAHGVDIIDGPGDQPADRVFIEETQGHILQVGEDFHPQVKHYFLSQIRQEIFGEISEYRFEDLDSQIDSCQGQQDMGSERAEYFFGIDFIDPQPDQARTGQFGDTE